MNLDELKEDRFASEDERKREAINSLAHIFAAEIYRSFEKENIDDLSYIITTVDKVLKDFSFELKERIIDLVAEGLRSGT